MYKHKLVLEDQMFHSTTWELPIVGDGAETGAVKVRSGGAEGRLAVTIRAKTPCTLEATKVLTLGLTESDDDITWAAIAPAITIARTGATGGEVFQANEEMLSLLVPKGAKKWLKAVVTCTNVANADTGTIDVFLEYLAN